MPDDLVIPAAEAPPPPGGEAAPAPEPAAEAAPAGEAEASPFDWSAWDGKAESAPEPHREVVGHVAKWFEPKLTEAAATAAERDELKRWFEMFDGADDPRLVALTAERDDWRGKHGTVEGEFKAFKESIEAERTAALNAWADDFEARHAAILGDAEKKAVLAKLLDASWDAEAAIEVIGLPPEARAIAEAAKAQGASDAIALRLAKAESAKAEPAPASPAAPPPPKPRPAAEVVAGNGAVQGGPGAHLTSRDAHTPRERRQFSAETAMRKHAGSA